MIERRLAYDEQIASANKLQRELLQNEREIENRRLEKMKKKMEQDYYDGKFKRLLYDYIRIFILFYLKMIDHLLYQGLYLYSLY